MFKKCTGATSCLSQGQHLARAVSTKSSPNQSPAKIGRQHKYPTPFLQSRRTIYHKGPRPQSQKLQNLRHDSIAVIIWQLEDHGCRNPNIFHPLRPKNHLQGVRWSCVFKGCCTTELNSLSVLATAPGQGHRSLCFDSRVGWNGQHRRSIRV
jgi:hypothetical protein